MNYNNAIKVWNQNLMIKGHEWLKTQSPKLEGQELLDLFKYLDECYGYEAPCYAGYRKEDGSPDTVAFFNAKVKAIASKEGKA